MGKQSKRPRNKKKGGSNSSPSKTTAAAATIAAATATAASMSSSSAETLPKINQPQQQYHKNENIVVDRHGGESAVGQRQKQPEQGKAVGKENSNINVVLRPMGRTTPFDSNYVGKYDQEDQCVSCQGLIDIDNHPWFCGHTGRILMV